MKVYIFHRDNMWYPLELKNDEEAKRNAVCNPGTTKVTDEDKRVIWLLNSEQDVDAVRRNDAK